MNPDRIGERKLQTERMLDLAEIARHFDFQYQAKTYFPEILKTICDATKAVSCCLKWFDGSLTGFELESTHSRRGFCKILNFPEWGESLKRQNSAVVMDVQTKGTLPDAVREKLLKNGIRSLKRIPIMSNKRVSGILFLAFSRSDLPRGDSGILDSQLRLIRKMSENFCTPSAPCMTDELIHFLERETAAGVLITSGDFRIVYANRPVEKLFHKKAEQFIGLPLKKANLRYGEILQTELESLKKHPFRTKQVQLVPRKGKEIVLEIKGTPLKTSQDEGYFLWLLNDRTKKVREQIALEKWRKNTEEFTYTVSHDLKAPIISIEGYISLLMAENIDELSGDGKFYIEKVLKNIRVMKNMIQDLLELSRIQQDKDEFRIASLGSILRNVLDEFQFQIEKKRIDLVLPNRFPRLKCNPSLVQVLFSNLISNAIKFMGDQQHPRIEICWKRNGSSLTLFFKDNGIGINPKSKDRIFDVFFRLQPSRGIEGSGVGLAIVKKIVEAHNGTIDVESEVGKGSTFIVSFPVQN
ncbi:MAG: PAS domain-containing sensor histidine kinase [Calditrichaeota bacterium]|nr:PAS domain-containing sensor histidine kinase [Calditrichota bacterium]